ncbi:MAG: PDZ domain-containing protein, partial [Bacteroidota bacterium]
MKKFVLPVLFLMLVCSSHAQHQRATIGIYSTTVSKSKAKTLGFENPYGSYVRKIYPNSGAAAAGLQAFDYVTGVNDEEVARHYTISDILSQYQPGDEVKVSLVRQNKPMEMMVRLGDRSNLKFARRTAEEDPFFGISPKHKRLPPGVDGVPVTIINNSTAQAMGLEDGDIVLTVDGNPVLDWHDIDPAVDNRQVGDPITVK